MSGLLYITGPPTANDRLLLAVILVGHLHLTSAAPLPIVVSDTGVMSNYSASEIDTSSIQSPRSIITLVVFVLTNCAVLFPFHVPFLLPLWVCNAILRVLVALRIISPPRHRLQKRWQCFKFPVNFVTAPLIADLFLLAILAIGRDEVYGGTIGSNNIFPIDIMAFFLTLAYVAISIDASGLVRYLAFKVLQKGGKVGHRLFFYLYVFFFGLGSFIGNDPIILSGTAFLAYMTRVSSNIVHPRAWIHSQFAVANIASAILVSSNPTNLVLAGAFHLRFIDYTANMIVPVLVTGIVLFPFLLYIVFADESLIPLSITMYELDEDARSKKPVNPNIPNARGTAKDTETQQANGTPSKQLSLEEIMNPFLDKGGATFGAIIMAATLITLLVLNATSQKTGEHPVFYVTLPAAFVMFCWDLSFGWIHRKETRELAAKGRAEIAAAEEAAREAELAKLTWNKLAEQGLLDEATHTVNPETEASGPRTLGSQNTPGADSTLSTSPTRPLQSISGALKAVGIYVTNEDTADTLTKGICLSNSVRGKGKGAVVSHGKDADGKTVAGNGHVMTMGHEVTDIDAEKLSSPILSGMDTERQDTSLDRSSPGQAPATLVSLCKKAYVWSQETFPTVTTVLAHLPFALVPFALSMFVLVQALVNKGWVAVFAYGWYHWVDKTGTVGSVGGMGFLSVILCNFAGTNIGTSILLSRVIQAWVEIHKSKNLPISDRTFWAAVYSMALGVNYGAFSAAFSASLAGLLWRDILARKHIRVPSLEFARVNLPIITISMIVGCTVLIAEIYIMRNDKPINFSKL
ncbi:putative arsenite efflux transporter [Grosmannia clavigera kw1407]|uniref:Putative arsenite efflux transporter n=1 Tax=Grosmannia clavigera (strain kw1407 / UAMH 11150) TaxID=655863 RepID=F0X7A3_GROCL|nr:putative arsenite efflux transporter [Grosmannia clavigera kw1407]EFX06454.1 putative arsenite efflux transporter [Grosmannia clavigera kw1407]